MKHRNSRNQLLVTSSVANDLLLLLTSVLLVASLASGQFIPASSHLGRLVQSITSPLVLSSGSYREASEADSAPPSMGGYQMPASGSSDYSPPAGSYADYGPSEGLIRPEASRPERQTGYYQPMPSLQLQQSPSQVRGIHPQQYYQQQQLHLAQAQAAHASASGQQQQPHMYRPTGGYHQQAAASYQQQDQADEQDSRDPGEGAGSAFKMHHESGQAHNPRQHYRSNDQGASSSNNQNNKHNSAGAGAEPELGYQMGAYLGPSIDDKEIQGAFNSNDDADDDDSSNAFPGEGPNPSQAGYGRHSKAASNAFPSNQADFPPESNSEYSPESSGPYSPYSASGHHHQSRANSQPNSAAYDEDSADEDDAPARPRPGGAGRGSRSGQLSRSASHARQRGSNYQQEQQQRRRQRGDGGAADEGGVGAQGNTGMMAAANGYAPFGYATGPVDLTGLMNGGYQVYGGDGSLGGAPYGPAGYSQYGPNGGAGNGRGGNGRNQAAASESYDGFDNTRDGFQAKNNDNDDNDPDDD